MESISEQVRDQRVLGKNQRSNSHTCTENYRYSYILQNNSAINYIGWNSSFENDLE